MRRLSDAGLPVALQQAAALRTGKCALRPPARRQFPAAGWNGSALSALAPATRGSRSSAPEVASHSSERAAEPTAVLSPSSYPDRSAVAAVIMRQVNAGTRDRDRLLA